MKTQSYLIKQEKGMKHITINDVKYVPETKKTSIYDFISNLLFGNKSCMPNELKSFR